MKYLKSLALLISLSTLVSCTEGFEDFPADVYSTNEINDINDSKDTKSSESNDTNDTTGAGMISIQIDEPDVEDINYSITIP